MNDFLVLTVYGKLSRWAYEADQSLEVMAIPAKWILMFIGEIECMVSKAQVCVRGGKNDDRDFLVGRVISTSIFLKGVTVKLTFWVYIWLIEMMYHFPDSPLPFD